MLFIALGGRNVLIANPRDINGFIKLLIATPFTALTGVNTLFHALLKHRKFSEINFDRVKISLGGGAQVQEQVAKDWQAKTGKNLLEGYGLTEASPVVTVNPLNLTTFNHSIGLPLPETEIKIVDSNGDIVKQGEPGELLVRGPQVMRGYWQRPDETEKVMTPDGFLLTGDIATQDEEGFIRIVDRKKDMILVSGFNVYPNEIEDVLVSHPKIEEAAVIGIKDAVAGERVKAFIVTEDSSLTQADIIRYCRDQLTGYKVPKQVVFRDELPKSPVGKILRKELRKEQGNLSS